ncbi:hypothetical protein NE686_18140 [Tissierella carlieri]|uniref:Uncharacterized protein n=1 Tax=Tissierella carlieri TaxID=689904 RepID=A0ABT1SF87_9FIRM|nr:hypothetical protein [Tissierella carlieri]MCQ4925027.1 hypothetical protein [Tissierella carlieri]
MSNKVVTKVVLLDRKLVKRIDKKLEEKGGNEEELFEIKFDDGKVAKVNICKSYPSFIRVELYNEHVFLDAMEQSNTILGDYIFWTEEGEYVLDIKKDKRFNYRNKGR